MSHHHSEEQNPTTLQKLVFDSLNNRSHLAGVDTRGCTCFHHGMSPAWHSVTCAWVIAVRESGDDNA